MDVGLQRADIRRKVFELVKAGHAAGVGDGRLPLAAPTHGPEEVWEAIESLLDGNLTMGTKVARFENAWADYVGVRHAVMVNSGSSANLLMLAALANSAFPGGQVLRPGDEVITPAVTWSTTVFPIAQVGGVPILVDVDPHTLTMDVEAVRRAITPRTRALLPVHLLGNPAHLPELQAIADDHDLALLEDACEAHGASVDGRKVGAWGRMASFSFYFSHHISTIEGGMVCTDDAGAAELVRTLRAHGWTRDRSDRDALERQHSDIDPRFLFVNTGYNLRPTEIQGAFGIHQVPRLEGFIHARTQNARAWLAALEPFADLLYLPVERPNTRHTWFGFPILMRPGAGLTRPELVAQLEKHGVATRPIVAGNFVEQPALDHVPHRVPGSLSVSREVMRRGIFIGNHASITPSARTYVAGVLRSIFKAAGAAGGLGNGPDATSPEHRQELVPRQHSEGGQQHQVAR